MKKFIIGCLFALAGLTFATQQPVQRINCVLTAEDRAILDHLSVVQIPDGQGGTVEALRVTGSLFEDNY